MLYYFLLPLHENFIGFNVLRYITFRTFLAIFVGMTVYLLLGGPFIRFLRRRQFLQTVRSDGPIEHLKKGTTPTMGGVLMMLAVSVSLLLCARLDNIYVWLVLASGMGFALIGYWDDYRKIFLKDANGLRARYKFPLQLIVGGLVTYTLMHSTGFDTTLAFPFLKNIHPNLNGWYLPFGILVVVGASNAVNLTDGLDGLATVPSIMAFLTYGIFAYLAGHAAIASYLQIPFISGAGELTVLCGAVLGSCLGFLWFNAHPADIFMGDVGALALGAMLGMVAMITKNEIVLVLVGGIFVLETLSVIVQVASFKLTGRRIFRMAPLHHHFELKGWKESKVIVRFWIISIILALMSLGTLKLR